MLVYSRYTVDIDICITFIQRRTNVFDIGPTLYKCYTNILCLLDVSQQGCIREWIVEKDTGVFSSEHTIVSSQLKSTDTGV